jgi:predicted nucleic acid-binding protein
MSVFVDTGVFYADHDRGASRHEVADEAVDAIYRGELGQPFTSDYVYDETVTLTLKRSGRFEVARSIGERIRGETDFVDTFSLLHVTPSLFEAAVGIFERYDDQNLSFDDDFDGIVDRVEPGDLNR